RLGRKGNDSTADVRAADGRDADRNRRAGKRRGERRKRRHWIKAVQSGKIRTHRKRVEAAQWPSQRQGIYRYSVACPHHGTVFDLVGKTHPRSEELLAGSNSEVIGITAEPA